MSNSPLLLHPDRFRIAAEEGCIDPDRESRIDNQHAPSNLSAHWQILSWQSRLIVQTTSALERQLYETDVSASVASSKIRITQPFYCAFASHGHQSALRKFEGAYIAPLAYAHGNAGIQWALIPREGEARSAEVHLARLERVICGDMPANAPSITVIEDTTNELESTLAAARAQLVKILLAMRLDLPRRAERCHGAPTGIRASSAFNRLEIGHDDNAYAITVRDQITGRPGLHRFRRGQLWVANNSLGWKRPTLNVIDRTHLGPVD